MSLGKVSFEEKALVENIEAFIKFFLKLPALSTKGQYVKSMFLSSTMGIGVQIDFKKYM